MCFFSSLSEIKKSKIEQRFGAKFKGNYAPGEFNAFSYPSTPIIAHNQSDLIQHFQWGLIPSWAKDEKIQSLTLNARIETIEEKPAFKGVLHNRCLIIANGFYEWQWLDAKGKNKKKYYIHLPDNELFAFAGLWSEWIHPHSGEFLQTYTILTSAANELMSHIHNTKKRMPLILRADCEKDWLLGSDALYDNDRLIADAEPPQEELTLTLF